jgi:hypothetical protein
MSIVADVLQIVEAITGILSKRPASDAAVFRECIDPLYMELASLVEAQYKMYSPVREALLNLQEGLQARLDLCYYFNPSDDFELLPIEEEDGEANDMSVLGESRQQHGSSLLDDFHEREDVAASFYEGERNQILKVLNDFAALRKATRPGRLRADAAATALLNAYSDRTDNFAVRTKQFATQIRRLIGRAGPGHLIREPKIGTDITHAQLRTLAVRVCGGRHFDIHDEPTSTVKAEDLYLQAALRHPVSADDMARAIARAIELTEDEINKAWESAMYIYATLRVASSLDEKRRSAVTS